MTYSVGGLIEAVDYNGFVSTSANNVNQVWGTGSGDYGWGQTALGTVSVGSVVTATNWASLVNTLTTMGNQTATTITSRTAPVTGNTISVLAAVGTDINSITGNRGNAASAGTINYTFSGTTSKTTDTGSGSSGWTITWTHTVTFPSADQARYFWNTGGIVRMYFSKTSTGTDVDPDWNTFVGKVGTLAFTGRVNSAAQTIGGVSYTGTNRINGTGGTETLLASTTGWYSLTAGAAATTIFQLNDDAASYTGDYIRVTAAKDVGSTTLTLTTTWVSPTRSGAGQSANITGGTATTSPYIGFGTAPTTMVLIQPPSTLYLSASWGTPTVTASVA